MDRRREGGEEGCGSRRVEGNWEGEERKREEKVEKRRRGTRNETWGWEGERDMGQIFLKIEVYACFLYEKNSIVPFFLSFLNLLNHG